MLRSLPTSVILAAMLAGSAQAESIPIPADYKPPFKPEAEPLEGLIITIDPGHGGSSYAPGYSGSARGVKSRVVEGDLNMTVTALLYHHLKDAGAQVHMTRRDDRKVVAGNSGREEELGARTRMAASTASHLFLSLHHNAVGRATADGVVILIDPTDKAGKEQPLEIAFADALREEVAARVHQTEPFKHFIQKHPLVSSIDTPSAVVEFGFLTNENFDAWVSQPANLKVEAEAAFQGVVRMWESHREELEALRLSLYPHAGKGEAPAGKEQPNAAFTYGAPSPNLWPFDRPVNSVTEARHVVDAIRLRALTDRTTVWFKYEVAREGNAWRLDVTTNLPELAETAREELEKATAGSVLLDLDSLPSERLDDSLYGEVAIPMALTWATPHEEGAVQTQLLFGEPLYLLDITKDRDYYLVQGVDGYIGWVRIDAVRKIEKAAFVELINGPRHRAIRNIMVDDFRIPPASFLNAEPSTQTLTNIVVRGHDGATTEVLASASLARTTTAGRLAAETALREYLYVPYVFGGRSNLGIDCSGLVGGAWAAAGLQLPRDANQQTLVGRLVGTRWFRDSLLPGDILFFVDRSGRTIHTGVSLGGSEFIHASPPEVQINSLDASHPLYSATWAEAFFVARRPLE